MPNKPKTPNRTFRIPATIYDRARAKAEAEGTNLTAVVNELLWRYVHEDDED